MVSPMKANYRRKGRFAGENDDFHFGNAEFEELGENK